MLNELRVIAMVGLSADPREASSFVANCLLGGGSAGVSINPKASVLRRGRDGDLLGKVSPLAARSI